MPAINMQSPHTPDANPSTGKAVIMSPFSGPTGSLFDNDQAGNHSTGALNTGIGFGPSVVIAAPADPNIKNAGFMDQYVPGISLPSGSDAPDARLTAIGGGFSEPADDGEAVNVPYEAVGLQAFGNGGSRDAGTGPEFTGFEMETATASGTVANGSAIETGLTNRSGISLTSGQSSFGVSTTAALPPEAP